MKLPITFFSKSGILIRYHQHFHYHHRRYLHHKCLLGFKGQPSLKRIAGRQITTKCTNVHQNTQPHAQQQDIQGNDDDDDDDDDGDDVGDGYSCQSIMLTTAILPFDDVF